MNFKIIYLLIFIILFLPIVSAAVYEQNKELNFKIPCSNDGYKCSGSSRCEINLGYPNGTDLLDNASMSSGGNGEFNITLHGNNLTDIGFYCYSVFCVDGSNNGTTSDCFEVTTTGGKVSLSNIIIVLVFLFISAMCFILGYTFDKEKWILKTGFYLFAMLMCVIAVNSGRIIASESTDLTTMSTMGFILTMSVLLLMFLYMFIYALVDVFKKVKDKRSLRWKY